MSYQPLWLRDLVAYSIQAAALVGVGVIMARLLPLRVPRVRLAYWHALLAVCVFLPLVQPWRPEVLETSGSVMSNVSFAASAALAAPSGPSVAEIILLLICAGIILRALWMALGLVRLCLYRRRAQRIVQVPQAVEEAQGLVPVFPALFISRQLQTPATFGFLRPAILFPARFLEMEPSMQKAVALHELLHVERRDWLWNMFEELVLTLLWFHVPLWWVVRSARLSREQVVDAEAVRRSNARRPYLKALLEMAGQKRLAESLPAALFLRESQLAERVALMMKEGHMSRKRLTVSILAAAGVLLIAGVSLVWAFPLKTSATQAATTETSSSAVQSEPEASGSSLPANPVAPEADSAKKSTKVYKVGGNVSAPIPIYKPEPPYSEQARKAKYQGNCVLWIVVNSQGNVTNAQVVKPLGMGLDQNALTTVKTWKFKPATRHGVPVPVKVMLQLSFRYDHGKKSGAASQKPNPAKDPPAQGEQSTPANKDQSQHNSALNQAEIQRQIDQAMKQLQKMNTPEMRQKMQEQMKQLTKMNTPEMRQKLKEMMEQAKIAQQAASKIDQAKIQRQIEQTMRELKAAQITASKIDEAEIQRQVEEAMKQLKAAKIAVPKINEAEVQRQVEQALEQAKVAQQTAEKINKAEIQRQIEQAKKQVEAARKEVEKAQQQAMKARQEIEKKRKEIKPPLPPTPPSSRELTPVPPVPPSPKALAPPPSPPAPPQN